MRISTQIFHERSVAGMGALQEQLWRTQQKLGTGTRFLKPSDDPVAAARALGAAQSLAESAQYTASRSRATLALSMEENALQSVTGVLQNVRTLLIQAGNGALSDADRASLAAGFESARSQLLGLANSDDGNGQYLFAGYRSGSAPFALQGDGSVRYLGDAGQRLVQVDVARQIAAADDGRSVFQSVPAGARAVASAAPGNSGTGLLGTLTRVDAAATGNDREFSIHFSGGRYTVVADGTPPQTVAAGAHVSGATLVFNGWQLAITGAPADGDTFRVQPARSAGTDVFSTLSAVAAALRQPMAAGGERATTQLANVLATANVKLANAYDNVLTVRSSVGARLAELDALDASGTARDLASRSFLSGLEDLDYARAISEFTQREVALKATQETFTRLQSLSLFNYLPR